MNMYLYYAIGFSGIGVMLMLRYYQGAGVATMILGIICMVLGSINGKKWQDSPHRFSRGNTPVVDAR